MVYIIIFCRYGGEYVQTVVDMVKIILDNTHMVNIFIWTYLDLFCKYYVVHMVYIVVVICTYGESFPRLCVFLDMVKIAQCRS